MDMIPVCERGVVENDQRGSMRILCHGYPLRPLSLPPPLRREPAYPDKAELGVLMSVLANVQPVLIADMRIDVWMLPQRTATLNNVCTCNVCTCNVCT